ncbi:hypothetical protein TNCV_1045001 [Trichonephila clavipes]|nr:hypothetical protein TNCV_1045001 [Trichonephila clavipes]
MAVHRKDRRSEGRIYASGEINVERDVDVHEKGGLLKRSNASAYILKTSGHALSSRIMKPDDVQIACGEPIGNKLCNTSECLRTYCEQYRWER